jgi:CDP-diglyceride synthetase
MVDDRPTVLDLQAMLDLLAQTVVNALGFAVAAVNLVESPRRVVVVSVAGPDEVRDRLLGTSDTLANWERMLAAGQTWGRLAFLDHSHVAFLLVLPGSVNPRGGGPGLVLYLLLLTEFNDVAQYIWGRTLGRHKVIPKVSPNKTVEGFLGGVATTLLLAWLLAPRLTPLTPGESILAGVIIGVGGFVGDVVISALKRDLGIKDSGALLPGHGGVLDRIDSLLYTAPLFFHFVWYLHGTIVTRLGE